MMFRHFVMELLVRGKVGPEKLLQNFPFHPQEITASVEISRKSASEMPGHFREQCRRGLVERPFVLGGSSTKVFVKELNFCAPNLYEIFRRT